jgi:hypothetical protein
MAALIGALTAKDPAARPRSAADVAAWAARIRDGHSPVWMGNGPSRAPMGEWPSPAWMGQWHSPASVGDGHSPASVGDGHSPAWAGAAGGSGWMNDAGSLARIRSGWDTARDTGVFPLPGLGEPPGRDQLAGRTATSTCPRHVRP